MSAVQAMASVQRGPMWREAADETSVARLNLPVSAAAKYRKLGIEISSQKSIGDTVIDTSF